MAYGTEDEYNYYEGVDPYGTRYVDSVFNKPVDAASGWSGLASGAGTGASIGSLFGPVGTAVGAGLGAGIGGLWGMWQGGKEMDTLRQQREAELAFRKKQRENLEQAFQDQMSAVESQRQLAEQMNPGAAIYGEQGRPGLLQMQQAQLAQQAAAQAAQARRGLAARGMLGSGAEAGAMGALAGQQAAAQGQLQADAIKQYQAQQLARQQQLGQFGTQAAQISGQRAAARTQLDQAAVQADAARQQQLAQRNQALLAAGLQGVSTGVGAAQQAIALDKAATQRQEDRDLIRQALGLPPEAKPVQQDWWSSLIDKSKADWTARQGQMDAERAQVAQGVGAVGQFVQDQFAPTVQEWNQRMDASKADWLARQGQMDSERAQFAQGLGAVGQMAGQGLNAVGQGLGGLGQMAGQGLNAVGQFLTRRDQPAAAPAAANTNPFLDPMREPAPNPGLRGLAQQLRADPRLRSRIQQMPLPSYYPQPATPKPAQRRQTSYAPGSEGVFG